MRLPDVFTQAVVNKRCVSCSTREITSLSDRAQEAIHSALVMTHNTLQTSMNVIRRDSETLFALTDGIAMLDMLASFADVVAQSTHTYTRPTFAEEGEPMVIQGLHAYVQNTHTLVCKHIHACAICTHTHTQTHTHTHKHKQTHKHKHTNTNKHTNTQTHKHTNTHKQTHTNKHTHTHTHTHTRRQTSNS